MKLRIFCDCNKQDLREPPPRPPPCASTALLPSPSTKLHEEYASAFRTESYTDFLAGVLDITLRHGPALRSPPSTSSFRLLSHHLLHPDQQTVSRLLSLLPSSSLLPNFFSLTADSSLLFSLLLKDLHLLRLSHRSILKSLHSSLPSTPFPSLPQLRAAQSASAVLLQRLDLARTKPRTKLRRLLCFAKRAMAQLDAAAKGTYILNRDLDTISRLVAMVGDEVAHMASMLSHCAGGKAEVRRRLAEEVARQLRRNDKRFRQQIDELEEHLYLCFMTVNKARSLVMKETGIDFQTSICRRDRRNKQIQKDYGIVE